MNSAIMDNNGDGATSPGTSAQGHPVAVESQWPPGNTDTKLSSRGRPFRGAPVPYSDIDALRKGSLFSHHSTGRDQANVDHTRISRTPQPEAPSIPTRPKSVDVANAQPPLAGSDESEPENDFSSHSKSHVESTEATSSIGQPSPLLTTDYKNRPVPTPADWLLDVPDDRAVSGSHDFDEDDSNLVEVSTNPSSVCDDRSLKIAQDSIRGGEITENIPRRADLDSYSRVKTRSPTATADSILQTPYRGHRANSQCPDDFSSSVDSESDDPDQGTIDNDRTLHSRIWKHMVKTPTGQLFLPNGSLDELITKDSVEEELRRIFTSKNPTDDKRKPEDEARKLSKRICIKEEILDGGNCFKPIRQIFAILVLMREASQISRFIKQGLSDNELPLSITEDEEKKINPQRRRGSCVGLSFEGLPYFKRWLPGLKDQFWEMQWRVIAPVLTEGEYNDIQFLPLHEKDILPFISSNDVPTQDVGHGGFGVVYTALIHPKHHNFSDAALCEGGFAIKQIDRLKKKSFYQERKILKKFKGRNAHPHVVNLLSTFKQGRNLSLVFYRAEGDLRDFWRKRPKPDFRKETVIWVAKQSSGIAGALMKLHHHYTFSRLNENDEDLEDIPESARKAIIAKEPQNADGSPPLIRVTSDTVTTEHDIASSEGEQWKAAEHKVLATDDQLDSTGKIRKYGRHGDIKPENLLWYKDQKDEFGVLRFTDFGVSELNSSLSKSKVVSNIAGTLAYRAPESDIPEWPTRQSADMWSLGCVYLEFITWLLGGESLLREFCEKRMSWDNAGHVKMDTFFDSDHSKGPSGTVIELKVKSCVTAFFDKLHQHNNCTEYIHDFLTLIQYKMLVLEPSDISETNRIRTDELSQKLRSFYEACCIKETYATEKLPWGSTGLKTPSYHMTNIDINLTKEKRDEKLGTGPPLHKPVISALPKHGVYTDHVHRDSPRTH
ncbi:hypothetical protein F4859DRAFT_491162 [Xylaria cf. heliscus]|nr:hypothetical protein F4859DRAFT_491162 [Xylaria cf. heliscus]